MEAREKLKKVGIITTVTLLLAGLAAGVSAGTAIGVMDHRSTTNKVTDKDKLNTEQDEASIRTYKQSSAKISKAQETVWRTTEPNPPTKISEAKINTTTKLSTKGATLTSFDVISNENTNPIPASTGRKVISISATTLEQEFEKNKDLYVYFVVNTAGTALRDTVGTFPANYNATTKTTTPIAVTNIPIEVRVATNFASRFDDKKYDVLAGYTIDMSYRYFFRKNPEVKGYPAEVLTLEISDFLIKVNGAEVFLTEASFSVRKENKHPYDTHLFQASSVIQTGF